jgi:hypothetical protein
MCRFDRFLGDVLLRHQFALHQSLGALAACISSERLDQFAPRVVGYFA